MENEISVRIKKKVRLKKKEKKVYIYLRRKKEKKGGWRMMITVNVRMKICEYIRKRGSFLGGYHIGIHVDMAKRVDLRGDQVSLVKNLGKYFILFFFSTSIISFSIVRFGIGSKRLELLLIPSNIILSFFPNQSSQEKKTK